MTRVDRQVASLRRKIGRLEEMVSEAEGRRAHLETHRAEIDAGLEPAPQSTPESASPMTDSVLTASGPSATATTGSSSPAS